MRGAKALLAASLVLVLASRVGAAQADGASGEVAARAALDDMWWTGPMLANSAATLPRGHVLLEPYVYDVATANANGFGSRSYLLYGATDRLTVGLIPVLGFTAPHGGLRSSRIGFGDLTLLAQYGLTQFHPGRGVPALAVMVQETLPTGRYDNLGTRPSDGLGAGTYTTSVGLNAQTYVWLPTGRALRMRINISGAMSRLVPIRGVSVYGTAAGFRGTASPGRVLYVDGSWEYSLTRQVALATDAFYTRSSSTRVAGAYEVLSSDVAPFMVDAAASRTFGFAPAVELSVTRNLGILLGVRVIPGQRSARSITPAVAVNFVH